MKYVKKLPREGSVIRKGITFKTHYEEISMPSNLYLIDDVLVVFLSENDPSKKKPMGRFDAPAFESKNPLEIVKNNFYYSNVSSLMTLSLIAGVSSGAGLALFLSQGGSIKKIQEVVQYALAGIAILGWWRLFQWGLCINKLFTMRHEGDWAAQLRAYAYSYPSVLNERAIQRFLLENEVQYLQGCAPSIFHRLKNNLSL
ncbi:MAG: hypothetical protein JSS10_04895 [Verrucomicrobia bacterium]|nr:hypothetical protein [Verrucomicrobiota bacterium]